MFSSSGRIASKIRFFRSPRPARRRVRFPVKPGERDIIPPQIRVVFNYIFNRLSAVMHLANMPDRQSRVPENGLAAQDAFAFFDSAQALGVQVNARRRIFCDLLEVDEKVAAKFETIIRSEQPAGLRPCARGGNQCLIVK
jgi:hypothetical protein